MINNERHSEPQDEIHGDCTAITPPILPEVTMDVVSQPVKSTNDFSFSPSNTHSPVEESTPNGACLTGSNAPDLLEDVTESKDQNSVAHISPLHIKRHTMTRLPNCRTTGIDYQASLAEAVTAFSPSEIQNVAIVRKEDCRLDINWDKSTLQISCHPVNAGEYEVELCVDVCKRERHIFPYKLTVNPDPKSLWKNIPSDQTGIYPKPDSDKLFMACDSHLSIVAASQRGRSHAQEGKPRDDDFAVHYDSSTKCVFMVVADGAGTAKFSREGSRIASLTAIEVVQSVMNTEFWSSLTPSINCWIADKNPDADKSIKKSLYVMIQAAWEAKSRIKQEAKAHEARYYEAYKKSEVFTARDYATTLIMTIAKRLDSGEWFVATYWAGDGAMGIYMADYNDVRVQGVPDGGEYGGQTRFVTEDSSEMWPQEATKLIARRLRYDIVPSFSAIVLMTDGVSDPKFETENNIVSIDKWNDLWADLGRAVPFSVRDASVSDALLNWMDFWSPGNHDDRTMVILY